jgi:hypothetical protein
LQSGVVAVFISDHLCLSVCAQVSRHCVIVVAEGAGQDLMHKTDKGLSFMPPVMECELIADRVCRRALHHLA